MQGVYYISAMSSRLAYPPDSHPSVCLRIKRREIIIINQIFEPHGEDDRIIARALAYVLARLLTRLLTRALARALTYVLARLLTRVLIYILSIFRNV